MACLYHQRERRIRCQHICSAPGLEGGVLKIIWPEPHLTGKHTFRNGFNQEYNASVSGANDKMNYYYMSLGYLRNDVGAVKYNDYQAVRSNLKLEEKCK